MFADHMEAKILGIAVPGKPVLSVSPRKIKEHCSWLAQFNSDMGEGFTIADSISLKISLLRKGKIELESSSQVPNIKRRRKHISRMRKYIFGGRVGQPVVLPKHRWKQKVSSTIKRMCDLEKHYYKEANKWSLLLQGVELVPTGDDDLTSATCPCPLGFSNPQ